MAPEGVVAFSRFYAPQFTGLVEGPSGNFVAKIKKKKNKKKRGCWYQIQPQSMTHWIKTKDINTEIDFAFETITNPIFVSVDNKIEV